MWIPPFIWRFAACNYKHAFFISNDHKHYTLKSSQNVCDAFYFLVDNTFIQFGNKLNKQIMGVLMCTNYSPVFWRFVSVLSQKGLYVVPFSETQADVIEAFSSPRYINDLPSIDNDHLDQIIGEIYQEELRLDKANATDIDSVSGFKFINI